MHASNPFQVNKTLIGMNMVLGAEELDTDSESDVMATAPISTMVPIKINNSILHIYTILLKKANLINCDLN